MESAVEEEKRKTAMEMARIIRAYDVTQNSYGLPEEGVDPSISHNPTISVCYKVPEGMDAYKVCTEVANAVQRFLSVRGIKIGNSKLNSDYVEWRPLSNPSTNVTLEDSAKEYLVGAAMLIRFFSLFKDSSKIDNGPSPRTR